MATCLSSLRMVNSQCWNPNLLPASQVLFPHEENVIELRTRGRGTRGVCLSEDPGSTFPDKHTLPGGGGGPPISVQPGRQCLPDSLLLSLSLERWTSRNILLAHLHEFVQTLGILSVGSTYTRASENCSRKMYRPTYLGVQLPESSGIDQ